MSIEKIKFRLQGHEKFSLREGWLNKGLVLVSENPRVFIEKNPPAPDVFGIGNNMVKSLRYWLKAFGLIEERGGSGATLTEFGNMILVHDKYFEKDFTLWTLHSYIAQNKEMATIWYLFFNKCEIFELTKEQIYQILSRTLFQYTGGQKFSEKSLHADIDVLLNMYSKESVLEDPEEKNISPFTHLGLLKKNESVYVKTHPDRRRISEWVILFELSKLMKNKDQISIENALNSDFGIINIYQISNVQANEYLDQLDALGYIHVNRTAGLDIIYRERPFTYLTVISDYFERHR